jgi:F-type H+-transporting ATPase subunit epsilon
MKLKVLLPTNILVDQEVTKVTAEAKNGSFGILPRHVDFVTILIPGLFSFETEEGEEFLAVAEGVLVKRGTEVIVSVRNAVRGKNLGELRTAVEEQFKTLDDQEKKTRTVIAKFEADFARRFLELEGSS